MANRETYTFTITKLYLQKPLHENKSTCVAFTCNECNCKTVWEVRRSITVQANHQARDGREPYSFGQNGFYKTFHLFHFQFIKCFKRLNFIAWFFLFIFLEKSKFKLHYVSQCNFPSPPINKTRQNTSSLYPCYVTCATGTECDTIVFQRWRGQSRLLS